MSTTAHGAVFERHDDKFYILGTIEVGDDVNFWNVVAKELPGRVSKLPTPRMTVVLHSLGGSLHAAYKIGNWIHEWGWDTHVEFNCGSACTYIFLSGARLSKTPDAEIWFHSASNLDGSMSPLANQGLAKAIKGLGYSDAMSTYGQESLSRKYLTMKDAERMGVLLNVVPATIPAKTFAHININKITEAVIKYKADKTVTTPPNVPDAPVTIRTITVTIVPRLEPKFSKWPIPDRQPLLYDYAPIPEPVQRVAPAPAANLVPWPVK